MIGIILSVVLLQACNYKEQKYPGYEYTEQGYYYKLLSFNENYKEIHETDFVKAEVEFLQKGNDSVLATEQFLMQCLPTDSICMSNLFLHLREGDSASFITPNYECVRNVLIPEFSALISEDKELFVNIKIKKVQTADEYYKEQYEYNLWLKSQRDFEYNNIDLYIASQRKQFLKIPGGIFKSILKPGSGKVPKFGDIVNINYQGSLLNGDVINHFTSLEFVYGSEWQVVEGIEKALATMQVGERAIIIVPSEFAWGSEGSSNKAIKPFTTVIFDLELRSAEERELEE